MIRSKEEVSLNGQMVVNLMVYGMMVNKMVKGFISMWREILEWVYGPMVNAQNGIIELNLNLGLV